MATLSLVGLIPVHLNYFAQHFTSNNKPASQSNFESHFGLSAKKLSHRLYLLILSTRITDSQTSS